MYHFNILVQLMLTELPKDFEYTFIYFWYLFLIY